MRMSNVLVCVCVFVYVSSENIGPLAGISSVSFDVKIKRLMKDLESIHRREPDAKVLVFTQFQGTIEKLKGEFKSKHWDFGTLVKKKQLNQI